ncbi:MAG: multicopper oxidase domain-containing protein [Sphingomonas bacterium]|nr:multicopper oxidase domain-containing protein [Sphingomonas bacterium]
MDRRQFLKLGSAVAAAGTLSPAMAEVVNPRYPPKRRIRSGRLDMTITPYNCPMIDGKEVYTIFFEIAGETIKTIGRRGLHPVIWAIEGETLEIRITNLDDRRHAFAITGLSLDDTPINPNGTGTYTFTVPPPGSYLYYDPYNFPVNRILGLNGALIVLPRVGTTTPRGLSPIPYNLEQQKTSPAVVALFDALGHGVFPGNKWEPYPPACEKHPRDMVWVTSEMDSALARRIADKDYVDGSVWKSSFVPDYFMINGASGFETAGHEELSDDKYAHAGLIEPEGYVGQPTMIRCLNAGLATHSLHIHGNDVYQLTTTNTAHAVVVHDNIFALDTWAMPPMARTDMLLPFVRPLDAPVWPPKQEPFPLRYVMHCHCEMSNTAGGGNYPQGMVTHWEMLGTYADYLKFKAEKC